MKKKDFSIIGIRLLGIYSIIESLPQFSGFTYLFKSYEYSNASGSVMTGLTIIAIGVLQVAVGVYLIKKAETLSLVITPQDSEEQTTEKISSMDFQAILFSVVGLYIFLSSIMSVFNSVWTVISFFDSILPINGVNKQYALGVWVGLFQGLIKSAFGLFLFFRAQVVSKWWHAFRRLPSGEKV